MLLGELEASDSDALVAPEPVVVLACPRVTSWAGQAGDQAARPPRAAEPQLSALVDSPFDALVSTEGAPDDLNTLKPFPLRARGCYGHFVRLRAGEQVPAAFANHPESVFRVEAGECPLNAAASWLDAREAHARDIGHSPAQARAVRALNAAALLALTLSHLTVAASDGPIVLRPLRLEVYGPAALVGPPDGANGPAHQAGNRSHLFRHMEVGALYKQSYARGFGWGSTVRMPGVGQLLVRATEAEDGTELGLTATARLLGAALGVVLGPSVSLFRVGTEVADVCVGTEAMRLHM